MKSIWSEDTQIPERQPLDGDIRADVCVIGAGMAGVLTARMLKARGVDVVVLEANRIGSGQTKNTTAKITSQHNLIYARLIDAFGADKARQYADANQTALRRFKQIIGDKRIDCHYEEKPAYVYATDDARRIEQEVKAAQALGIDAEFTDKTRLPFPVKGAVKFPRQAQFNPLEFLRGAAEDLTIYEQTMVKSLDNRRVTTDRGGVAAKSIVMCAHFPFINVPGFYFARMYQQRSYVVALENAAQMDGMYIDADESGFSFRNYENYLLLGGAGHRSGENLTGDRYETLRGAARQWFPNSAEKARWSAQDCMTLDGVPYIGQFAATTPNVYVATGFQKWGMSTSMAAAELIADAIVGKKNPYAEVFSPQRFHLSASAETLLENGKESVKALSRSLFQLPDTLLQELPAGHGGVVEYEGEKLGVYKDESGRTFVVSVKCPHLGCQLEWNPDEKSWDCPCHGSRFDYEGNLLNNPALEGLKGQ